MVTETCGIPAHMLGADPLPLTENSPDFREARAAMARGRLCRDCGVGYRRRMGRGLWVCPNYGCGLDREFVAQAPNLTDEMTAWTRNGLRQLRSVAVDLSRVVLTPAPASDVVWVWLEVTQ